MTFSSRLCSLLFVLTLAVRAARATNTDDALILEHDDDHDETVDLATNALNLLTTHTPTDLRALFAAITRHKSSNITRAEQKTLEYVQAAIKSRLILIHDNPEINFNYKLIKTFAVDDDAHKTFAHVDNVKKRLNKYKTKIFARIKQTNVLISTKIKTHIDERLRATNNTLIAQLNAIKSTDARETLEWRRLEDAFQTKNLLETLKILSRSLGFIACVYDKVMTHMHRYTLIAHAVNGTRTRANETSLGNETDQKTRVQSNQTTFTIKEEFTHKNASSRAHLAPASLVKYVHTVIKKYQKLIQREWDVMKNALEIFKNEIRAKDDEKYRAIERVFDACHDTEFTRADKSSYDAYVTFVKTFKAQLMQHDDVNKTNSLNVFNNALMLSQVVQECYRNWTDTLGRLNLIKISQNVYIVNRFKQDMFEIFLPAFRDLNARTLRTDVHAYFLHAQLKSVKLYFEKRIENVHKPENLHVILHALQDCFNTLITISIEMRYYAHQAELYAYVKDLDAPVDADDELTNICTRARASLEADMILDYYNRSVNEFIKFIFPITYPYLEYVQTPSAFMRADDGQLIENVTQSLVYIDHLMKIFYTSRGNVPFFVHDQLFASLYRSSLPFFTWTRDKHAHAIRRLLRGDEVLLYADVQESFVDAIVCVQVGLNITTRDYARNVRIARVLEANYTLTMTHSGNSYYKCNKDYYLIKTDVLNVTFDYAERARASTMHAPYARYFVEIEQFHKVSPFTMWTFQLVRRDGARMDDFDEFLDDVYLELSGVGHFVAPDHYVHTNNLHRFYMKMEELSDDDCPR